MGQELEIKLAVADEAQLAAILTDREVCALAERWMEKPMKTTYYDTPAHSLSSRKWMLRQRREGSRSVVCFKMPLDAHLRGEWETEASAPNRAALDALVRSGAPKMLTALSAEGLVPACGAEFQRRCAMLHFADGSQAELAGDCGTLHGRTEKIPFTELELELYGGSPEAMLALAQVLMQRYGLHEEPLSKFARARNLK